MSPNLCKKDRFSISYGYFRFLDARIRFILLFSNRRFACTWAWATSCPSSAAGHNIFQIARWWTQSRRRWSWRPETTFVWNIRTKRRYQTRLDCWRYHWKLVRRHNQFHFRLTKFNTFSKFHSALTGGVQISSHHSIHTCYHTLRIQKSINKCSWFNYTKKPHLQFPKITNSWQLHCLSCTIILWVMDLSLLACHRHCAVSTLFITVNQLWTWEK